VKKIAAAMLLLVFMTHYVPDIMALRFDKPESATKALFYIARGLEGAVLYALLALLARLGLGRGGWIIAAPCLWGAFEEALTAGCRLSKPIAGVPGHRMFSGLCGDKWYLAGLFAAAVIGGLILDFREKKP
jgi:hypothetical protein